MNVKTLPFFQHIKWRPDAQELRRFAIAMLIGFSLLGLFAAWRAGGINQGAITLWAVGVFLATAAFVPGLGRVAYLAVYLPTSIIGYVVSHVVLAVMFFLIITPMGFILRLLGKDPLQQRRRVKTSGWNSVDGDKSDDSYYRQF